MSPEDFRKISHPEPKISNSLVNCTHTHGHTDTHTDTLTWVNLELTPPEGGSAKNRYSKKDIESDITKLGKRSKDYRNKKKILESGGKIEENARTFFSKTYKEINLEELYKINNILNEDGRFPNYKIISTKTDNKITKNTYSEL